MWTPWKRHFEMQAQRPFPVFAEARPLHPEAHAELLRSLAVFQKGETGEGRIAHEIDHVVLPGIDDDYRAALKLFVREEGRHARILGDLLRAHGAPLLETTWTDRLFVTGRRALGVRVKLLVLLAAEVIGMSFYTLIASHLDARAEKDALNQISVDETHHLAFHSAFFRAQCTTWWRRLAFLTAWWLVGSAACAVVLLDHRKTVRALNVRMLDVVKTMVAALRKAQVSSSDSSKGLRSPNMRRRSRAAARETSTA